ncbi:hypothetical protein Cfor_09863 [Coptotermes formosanus]|uniref:Uncharacterized protein n=1 Tax=Coptotermes formosanus TaxID=36987 RepID=A0A6L2PFF3_COPFO|nr:hypothetical protein Cfor_09863 [Coptotermes formosanus]
MVAVMPTGIRSSIITRHIAQEHRDGDRLEQMGHMLDIHNRELGRAMAKAVTTMVMLVQGLDSRLSRISKPPLSFV